MNPKKHKKCPCNNFCNLKLTERITRFPEVDDICIIQSHPSTFMQVKPMGKVPPKQKCKAHENFNYRSLKSLGPRTKSLQIIIFKLCKETHVSSSTAVSHHLVHLKEYWKPVHGRAMQSPLLPQGWMQVFKFNLAVGMHIQLYNKNVQNYILKISRLAPRCIVSFCLKLWVRMLP